VITAAQTDVALALEGAAMLVEAEPGLNVLDALQRTAAPIKPHAARDQLVGDTYYALLGYLPPHVEEIGAWSDAETSDRVAQKLRQLARTIRKGGPAHVDGQLPPLADPSDVALTERAEAAGRGRRGGGVPGKRNMTPVGRLRIQRAAAQRWLAAHQRKAHPPAAKVTELELRIAAIDRELAELEGDGEEEDGERELVAVGNGNGHRDSEALALIEQSQRFPLERRPTTLSGL
jgi:hypothetical protein